MIRKTALALAAVLTLMLGAFALGGPSDASASSALYIPTSTPAAATPTPPFCSVTGYNGCLAYPEFVKPTPTVTATPRPSATPDTAAIAAAAAADDANNTARGRPGGASIAFTGSESRTLGFIGAGLVGMGAIAVAFARRVEEDAE